MTKATTTTATNKKIKKIISTEIDNEYDVSIFDIRDRHYGSLLALKKKVRSCEKKLRELEQTGQQKQSETKLGNTQESEKSKKERLSKIESKKLQLSIWKEAAMCIHNVRKEEISQGISNISMADISEGVELLRNVVEKDDKWEFYKCPNKKHLQKSEIERIRQLAIYLNVNPSSNEHIKSNFTSFLSVVDYLTSPIAIGQECPMSFTEFVRLFDKVRKTLEVDIVVKESEAKLNVEPDLTLPQSPANLDGNTEKNDAAVTANVPKNEHSSKYVKKHSQRPPKGAKHYKKVSTTASNNTVQSSISQSLQSLPEKLVVVITDNVKSKAGNEKITPIVISSDDTSKQNIAMITNEPNEHKNETTKNLPLGRFIRNPNVPSDDDSDNEGWLAPESKYRKGSSDQRNVTTQRDFRKGNGNPVGARRNGNTNFRRGDNDGRPSNRDNKKTQPPLKSFNTNVGVTARPEV